jgi:hypothetical protein
VRKIGLVGLARRKDERVIDPLIHELSGDEVLDIAVEAAAELGDPRCYPALLRLRERYGCEGYMETALRQCAPAVLS